MAYSIMIDEDQRKIIETALAKLAEEEKGKYPDYNDDPNFELLDLIKELPEIEKNDPGILHGLCL